MRDRDGERERGGLNPHRLYKLLKVWFGGFQDGCEGGFKGRGRVNVEDVYLHLSPACLCTASE